MNKFQNKLKILSNKRIKGSFYHLILEGKNIKKKILPGQFVTIRMEEKLIPFLRRPFSIAKANENIEILYNVVGLGTKELSLKKTGEFLDVLGPLGTSFSMPSKRTKQIVLIAGGIGVAPLLFLADRLRKYSCKKIFIIGGRTKAHIYYSKELKNTGYKIFISTDDGSMGVKGNISVFFPQIEEEIKDTMIYTCGPRPMIKEIKSFASLYNMKGEASYEEIMACGIGACLGCVCKTNSGYKTVCNDGPVFDLNELVLD